jgi:aminoglycoside/choline kinase family phosphotransferase
MVDTSQLIDLYQSVIAQIIRLSRLGAVGFDRRWTHQTADYDHGLILDKECSYFLEQFLNGYIGLDIRFPDLESEFNLLAQKALLHPFTGFMHRDMQSRNIMVKDQRIYFIDFQGGRIGPLQYDLASLLIDPYVGLPQPVQARLFEDGLNMLSAVEPVNPDKFRQCYHYCTLTRNLQMLGAYSFLSKVQGKKQFEQYIPPALKTLGLNLKADGSNEFPRLRGIVEEACSHLGIL